MFCHLMAPIVTSITSFIYIDPDCRNEVYTGLQWNLLAMYYDDHCIDNQRIYIDNQGNNSLDSVYWIYCKIRIRKMLYEEDTAWKQFFFYYTYCSSMIHWRGYGIDMTVNICTRLATIRVVRSKLMYSLYQGTVRKMILFRQLTRLSQCIITPRLLIQKLL